MFDPRKSIGKTIEIKIEEDADEVICEQVIFAIIGSVSIACDLIEIRFLSPIRIVSNYIVCTQSSATVYGDKLAIAIDIYRDKEGYGSEVSATILGVY